jgi:hypothetical protein
MYEDKVLGWGSLQQKGSIKRRLENMYNENLHNLHVHHWRDKIM